MTGAAEWVVLLMLCAGPGVVLALKGRAFRPAAAAGDPTFAERWARYNNLSLMALVLAVTWLVMFGDRLGVSLTPLAGLAILAGRFAAHRRAFESTWSFGRYLGQWTRAFLVIFGFWCALILAPLAINGPGGPSTVVAIAFATLIWPWAFLRARGFKRALRSQPVDLETFVEARALIARSRVPAVQVAQWGAEGGRTSLTLALPDKAEPLVLFGRTVVDQLTPAQRTALLAQQIGHLEHTSTPTHRLRLSLLCLALAVGAVAGPHLFAACAPGVASIWLHAGWTTVVLAAFQLLQVAHQKREPAADQRAIALGIEPETLVSALVRYHELTGMPRRPPSDLDPLGVVATLAGRIQKIRQHARPHAAGAAETPYRASAGGTTIVAAVDGTHVAIGPQKVSVLGGVPVGTPPDLPSLQAAAGVVRAVDYRQVAELRVVADGDRRKLVLRQRDDSVIELEVSLPAAAELDQAIVGIEHLLPAVQGRKVKAGTFRWLAGVAALPTLVLGQSLGLSLVAVSVAVKPSARGFAALAAALTVKSLGGLVGVTGGRLAAAEDPFAAVTAMMALLFTVFWYRNRHLADGKEGRLTSWVVGLASGLTLLALALAAVESANSFALHELVNQSGGAIAVAAALVGVLFAQQGAHRKLARFAAGMVATIVVGLLLIGSPRVGGRLGHDPLRAGAAPIEAMAIWPRPLSRVNLDEQAWDVQISPDGQHFVVDGMRDDPSVNSYIVGDMTGKTRRLEAEAVRVIDDEVLLVLGRSKPGWALSTVPLDEAAAPDGWRVELPGMRHPVLAVDPRSRRWRVSAASEEPPIIEGRIGERETNTLRAPKFLPIDGRHISVQLPLGANGARIGIGADIGVHDFGVTRAYLSLVTGVLAMPRHEVWLATKHGERPLLTSGLGLQCEDGVPGDATIYCIGHSPRGSVLWKAEAAGDGVRVAGIARMPPVFMPPRRLVDGRLLIGDMNGGLFIVDPGTLTVIRPRIGGSDDAACRYDVAGATLAALCHHPGEPGSFIRTHALALPAAR